MGSHTLKINALFIQVTGYSNADGQGKPFFFSLRKSGWAIGKRIFSATVLTKPLFDKPVYFTYILLKFTH